MMDIIKSKMTKKFKVAYGQHLFFHKGAPVCTYLPLHHHCSLFYKLKLNLTVGVIQVEQQNICTTSSLHHQLERLQL